MAHDRAQSLLLPQPGFIPSQSAFGSASSGPRGFRDSAISYTKLSPVVLPPGTYVDHRLPSHQSGPPVRPLHATGAGLTEVANEHDHQIITFDDLEKLLPRPKPTGRVEVGLLPDGSAYAPKTGENYLLFPSKSSYILYFTHHYFSRENLSRDVPLLRRMVNRLILPLDKLIKAPRLVALNTTEEEVEQALVKSKIVCLEDMGNGLRGVRRIDGFPAIESGTTRTTVVTGSDTVSSNGVASSQLVDAPNDDERMLSASFADISISTKGNSLLGHSADPSSIVTSAIVSSPSGGTGSSGHRLSPNLLNSSSVGHLPIHSTVIVGQMVTTYDNAINMSSTIGSVPSSRPTSAVWSQPSTFSLSPNSRSSLLGSNASQMSMDSSIHSNNHSASILGFPSRPPYGPGMPTGNLHPSDLQPISVLPMRQQTALPQYLLSQSTHGSAAYSSPLSFCQMCYPKTHVNMAVAAAVNNPVHQQLSHSHLNPNPQFHGQLYHGQPGQVTSLTAHQASVALAAASPYHAAFAAFVAAAQQQVSPAYFNPSIAPNMHSQMQHVPHAVQPSVPFYYTTQPLSLPAHFQRHQLPRFSHGTVYPVQNYQPSNPVQPCTDVSGALPKESSGYSHMGTATQIASSVAYPFLLQPHVQLHHTGPPPMHNPNLVAAAAAGLHIPYPQQPTSRQSSTSYNFTPLGMNVISGPVSAPVQTQTVVDEIIDSSSTGYQDKGSSKTADGHEELTSQSNVNKCSIKNNAPVSVTSIPSSTASLSEKDCHVRIKEIDELHRGATTEMTDQVELAVHKPSSPDDSEDSASSGIGEMNSAGSSGAIDTRTNSSLTLTEQPSSDSMTSTACEFSTSRHCPRSRTKDVERSP